MIPILRRVLPDDSVLKAELPPSVALAQHRSQARALEEFGIDPDFNPTVAQGAVLVLPKMDDSSSNSSSIGDENKQQEEAEYTMVPVDGDLDVIAVG